MKTLEELRSGETITPAEAYEYARAYMDPAHIEHHETDLYLQVDDVSRVIVGAIRPDAMLTTFTSWIDHTIWYELPFCYIPGWTATAEEA